MGPIDKNFIDCGGTIRSQANCSLQIWVAKHDEAHRFSPAKLARVIEMAAPILRGDDLEVELITKIVSDFPNILFWTARRPRAL